MRISDWSSDVFSSDLLEQLIHFGVAQDDRQQAVLEAVVEEDVGIARRDDAAKTILFKGPWRVFATGTAAEVLTGQQDTGTLVTLGVEYEILVQRALEIGRASCRESVCQYV